MRPATMRSATMRRIDLQIVRWRRRAQAPAPARPTAAPYRRISPDGDPRTGAQDQRPPDTLLPCAARWSLAPASGLPPGSGAGKHTCWLLDQPTPPASSRRSMVGRPRTGAAARPFPGRSEDRSYGGLTVDPGRAAKRCWHALRRTLTKLSSHEPSRGGGGDCERKGALYQNGDLHMTVGRPPSCAMPG